MRRRTVEPRVFAAFVAQTGRGRARGLGLVVGRFDDLPAELAGQALQLTLEVEGSLRRRRRL
jgi:hypothetical protein